MKRLIYLFTAATLFLCPVITKADTYPINKNIDVKHYAFELSLSDNNDEIIGVANITITFKQAGISVKMITGDPFFQFY